MGVLSGVETGGGRPLRRYSGASRCRRSCAPSGSRQPRKGMEDEPGDRSEDDRWRLGSTGRRANRCGWMERYSGLVVHLQQRWEFVAKGEKMIARIVGNMILSVTVFVVVTLMVGLGVSWWSGGLLSGAVAGLICGLAAALVVGAVRITMGRSAEHPRERQGDENERSGRGPDREEK